MNRPPQSIDPREEELDTEILSIRAESMPPTPESAMVNANQVQVNRLQRQKRVLASSLLSSNPIQRILRKAPPTITNINDEVSPLAHAANTHSQSNHYRIAFGTTAFPFKDPSPTAPSENLLGVRIDVCVRNGRFTKPYYVLLRRERSRGENQKRLRVYRHTVPSFISIAKLENFYLPFPGAGRKSDTNENESGSEEDPVTTQKRQNAGRKQDLRGFVRELRRELVSWHLRTDAVDLLRERLGLEEGDSPSSAEDRLSPESRCGILSLEPTAIEARYMRLEWEDGRVGRFKLTNSGIVERAVVIGDRGRDKPSEDAMTGKGGRIETLLDRLKEHGSS
ncbi:Centromere protein Cenp-O [Penicillium capsulatum]|uniref:Centromere protein Cenp-O n=1 Tax=Penicillium capsulatum TaxID=69766 RepID=A0A9W9LM00_9EURO|nr:Centromere protein Cenp-O [Penicillium capsulatum]KAJ6117455.1 Centromere protein Cenp-O [Penicillium capsulatum]